MLVLRAVAAWLRAAAPGSSAFVSGSFGEGRPLYGVSDVDLVIVTPADAEAARARVRERWRALCRRLPLVPSVVELAVYERGQLARATSAPALTYGIRADSPPAAAYRGRGALVENGLLEGPGLYGPMTGWRPLSGPGSLPAAPRYDRQTTRIAAWLQLQSWWRFAFRTCVGPNGPRSAFTCVKFVSEPVRILLWLTHAERIFDREAALVRALRLLPEHELAIGDALDLHARLPAAPAPPVAQMLPHLVELSSRIAELLGREVAGADRTEVALVGDCPNGCLPLVDWRALVCGWLPDECLLPDRGDPRDPGAITRSALRGGSGRQPALRHGHLTVLPVARLDGGLGRLRALQCRLTDPVSLALLDGRDTASFPGVAGWSARDWALRAVAEHGAWLATRPESADPPPLAGPIMAARAALFLSSLEEGDPLLTLTPAATLRELADRVPGARTVAEEAAGEFEDWRALGRAPDPAVSRALIAAVRDAWPHHHSRARAETVAC
jgi:hypothetical protein